MRKTGTVFIISLLVIFLFACQDAFATSPESEFAMFKRIISPAFKWGENGILTVPKANTIGRYHLYTAVSTQDAGTIEDKRLFLTTGSIMLGTSDDVELGYTKRTFIWSDFYRSDIDMDTVHIKARIFHLSDMFIPQVSVGINGASINGNTVSEQGDILFNPYVVATSNIPIGKSDYALLSLTGMAEVAYNKGASSDPFLSVGADLRLFNHLYLMLEVQGLNLKNQRQVINAGAKYKLGWVSIGLGGFNLAAQKVSTGETKIETKNSYLMLHVSLEIPFEKLFDKKAEVKSEQKEAE